MLLSCTERKRKSRLIAKEKKFRLKEQKRRCNNNKTTRNNIEKHELEQLLNQVQPDEFLTPTEKKLLFSNLKNVVVMTP